MSSIRFCPPSSCRVQLLDLRRVPLISEGLGCKIVHALGGPYWYRTRAAVTKEQQKDTMLELRNMNILRACTRISLTGRSAKRVPSAPRDVGRTARSVEARNIWSSREVKPPRAWSSFTENPGCQSVVLWGHRHLLCDLKYTSGSKFRVNQLLVCSLCVV